MDTSGPSLILHLPTHSTFTLSTGIFPPYFWWPLFKQQPLGKIPGKRNDSWKTTNYFETRRNGWENTGSWGKEFQHSVLESGTTWFLIPLPLSFFIGLLFQVEGCFITSTNKLWNEQIHNSRIICEEQGYILFVWFVLFFCFYWLWTTFTLIRGSLSYKSITLERNLKISIF